MGRIADILAQAEAAVPEGWVQAESGPILPSDFSWRAHTNRFEQVSENDIGLPVEHYWCIIRPAEVAT